MLLTVVAEARARKIVARAFSIPSGAIPVLAAIAFRENNGESTRPREIYAARLAAEPLIRAYIRALIEVGLVQAHYVFTAKTLRLTSQGYLAANRYQREIREGCTEFGQVRLVRVLTNSLAW